MAALCMAGDNEWAMGSPTTANSLVALAAGIAGAALEEPLDGVADHELELVVGAPVVVELAAEGIFHLGLVSGSAGVMPQQEYLALAAQCVHPVHVMRAHAEDEVRRVHDGPRQEGR